MTRVILDEGFCYSALGSAQNDRMRGLLLRMKVFRLEKTNRKELGSLGLFYGCFEHWFSLTFCSLFFIDVMYIGFFDCFIGLTRKE